MRRFRRVSRARAIVWAVVSGLSNRKRGVKTAWHWHLHISHWRHLGHARWGGSRVGRCFEHDNNSPSPTLPLASDCDVTGIIIDAPPFELFFCGDSGRDSSDGVNEGDKDLAFFGPLLQTPPSMTEAS
mmetsp:Transcript_18367/g.24884  ORF Transcript_18367/g.24884 Transcript_18367/m.24884 type:complete len:128 (-) Transcript_18367:84-467(-)